MGSADATGCGVGCVISYSSRGRHVLFGMMPRSETATSLMVRQVKIQFFGFSF
jgi:hypothetical protein